MTRRALAGLASWPAARWWAAAAAAAGFTLLVAIPTDLIDTPAFGREIPPTWWSWPSLVVSSVLVGLVAATYVDPVRAEGRGPRRGWAGGLLTFFAVGCPVCNKLVLVLLGTSGALTWFEPAQPLLQATAVVLLAWALRARLVGELACAVPPTIPTTNPNPNDRGAAHV